MQMGKANEIAKNWDDGPCDHPNVEKEYHLGAATGDYVCTTCGKSDWGRAWVEADRRRNREQREATPLN